MRATTNGGMERITLTLPPRLYKQFNEIIKEQNMKKVEAIRIAIRSWINSLISQQMAEGYSVLAEENLEMLKEFETIDNENWF